MKSWWRALLRSRQLIADSRVSSSSMLNFEARTSCSFLIISVRMCREPMSDRRIAIRPQALLLMLHKCVGGHVHCWTWRSLVLESGTRLSATQLFMKSDGYDVPISAVWIAFHKRFEANSPSWQIKTRSQALCFIRLTPTTAWESLFKWSHQSRCSCLRESAGDRIGENTLEILPLWQTAIFLHFQLNLRASVKKKEKTFGKLNIRGVKRDVCYQYNFHSLVFSRQVKTCADPAWSLYTTIQRKLWQNLFVPHNCVLLPVGLRSWPPIFASHLQQNNRSHIAWKRCTYVYLTEDRKEKSGQPHSFKIVFTKERSKRFLFASFAIYTNCILNIWNKSIFEVSVQFPVAA